MLDKFNESKYKQQYNKEHYRTFKVDLKKEELDKLEQILKELGLTKAQFLRDAIIQVQSRDTTFTKKFNKIEF